MSTKYAECSARASGACERCKAAAQRGPQGCSLSALQALDAAAGTAGRRTAALGGGGGDEALRRCAAAAPHGGGRGQRAPAARAGHPRGRHTRHARGGGHAARPGSRLGATATRVSAASGRTSSYGTYSATLAPWAFGCCAAAPGSSSPRRRGRFAAAGRLLCRQPAIHSCSEQPSRARWAPRALRSAATRKRVRMRARRGTLGARRAARRVTHGAPHAAKRALPPPPLEVRLCGSNHASTRLHGAHCRGLRPAQGTGFAGASSADEARKTHRLPARRTRAPRTPGRRRARPGSACRG